MNCRGPVPNNRNDMELLVDTARAECVFEEVKRIVSMVFPDYDFTALASVFRDAVRLYNGEYPGYRRCNTEYHDLNHTTNVLLTMARLIHGLHVEGYFISRDFAALGLISSLMHDTGYIQKADDCEGTGSKYTLVHVERSIMFMRDYFLEKGYTRHDYERCSRIVAATDPNARLSDIPFESEEEAMTAKAIYVADLLGQMADRVYLEKLLFLFIEFTEGNVRGYRNEDEFLAQTIGFYERIRHRLEAEMGYEPKYMKHHFNRRWNIDRDLYIEAVDKNIAYLRHILGSFRSNYRDMLKRGGIVKRLQERAL